MAYMESFATFGGNFEAIKPQAIAAAVEPRLSSLEWQVVALAERDHPSSLRTPGRLATALSTVFGFQTILGLADERLEALRRIAVLSWRRGYAIDPGEVRAFLAAGFSTDQYELVVNHIGAARAARRNRKHSR